ncbi:FMN-binding glutamate synthase family protein [Virgibacillus dakarensis]|uniref:Glutamate synthase large subunit-like protein YerD n=1 Tax=Lentibacillus populi TaxID=1827502 RepID=A0A9W5TWC7_9BACI|nr:MULTISPECIES: FMN-binding glutamate synthase family protein [Bacillaceae]MBT2218190.1 FMN-binding glutamate synthase family protein [Virgibacillus dakarensis]MTW87962.1 FMN-binding glutamate synthase family protein [Virgibacillus dakarensis]GGB37657.1 glutamate synthase large subunit-like protein YerD [Lentibacillus populi]
MNIANVMTIIGFVAVVIVLLVLIIIGIYLFFVDRTQKQHPVLRNYPVLGRVRYFFEKIGPELRQYFFNNDNEGKPFSRRDYQHIVKTAKYKRDVIGFGSQRDFESAGFYVRNSMFPKLTEELKMDRDTKVTTQRYLLLKDPLFTEREEKLEENESLAYLLEEDDAIVIGENTRQPFIAKGQIGMSAMSYGALGKKAITALSEGLGIAKGTWMNTGEGGLSEHHLKGGVDIIMQIGPGLFGVRDKDGSFDWDELLEKSKIPQIKAFELKLAQGAKTRGGHIDGEKVTEEIARIRKVEPFKSVDSPNRFTEYSDIPSLFHFIERIREHTGKPVGMKIVIGSPDEAEELAKHIKDLGKNPDFITIDGGEGGTGASYQELTDSVGLPIKSSLPLVHEALVKYGVRDRVKIIASGKLFSPDRVAIALGMGADLVNVARGFMITVGCIQTLKCQSNVCPVGVATTDPELQKALVIDEKKWRTANYVITLRKGLFRIAAAAGLDSPVKFAKEHVVYKDEKGNIQPW